MFTPAIIIAASTAAAEHGHEAKGGLPQLNPDVFAPQLVWLAITFTVLYFSLAWLILPRIGQVLEERRNRIQRDLDEAERLKKETEEAIAGYEQALAEAKTKAGAIAKETREKLAAETEKQRAEVEATINAKIADAESRIKATKQQALAEVDGIAADTASEIVTKLIGGSVSPEDIKNALSSTASAPQAGE